MWRPLIEGGRCARPRDVLVSSLRDASEAVVAADPSTLNAGIDVLERDAAPCFGATIHSIGFSRVVMQRPCALDDTHLPQVMQSLTLLVEHVDHMSLVLGADAEIR
jgi:hypothetical protein